MPVLVEDSETDGVVGEVMGEPCAPKARLNLGLLWLGLLGGEMAVVFCSGLGAGFRNLEEKRGVDQHEALLGNSVLVAVVRARATRLAAG